MKPTDKAIKSFREAIETEEIQEHRDQYNGLCYVCGCWSDGMTEPDARGYKCEECGHHAVYGAEEAIIDIGY